MKTNLKLLVVLCLNLVFCVVSYADTTPRPYSSVIKDSLEYEYYTSVSRDYVCVKAAYKEISNVKIAKSVVLDGVVCEVTDIQYSGFKNCTKIKNIDIPDNITNIGFGAFEGCTGLEKITIPTSVKELGYDSFRECTSIRIANFLCDDIELGGGIFMGCSSLETVSWPQKTDTIPFSMFRDCTSFKYLYKAGLPSTNRGINLIGIKKLETAAFRNCKSIEKIFNTDSLQEIGANALYECSSLKELKVSEKIKVIENTSLPSSLKSLVINAVFDDYSFLWKTGISYRTTLYMPSKEILKIKESGYSRSNVLSPIEIWPYFKLETKDYMTCINGILTKIDDKVDLPEISFNNGQVIIRDNEFWLEGLEPNNAYKLQFNIGETKDIYVRTSDVDGFGGYASDVFLCGFNSIMTEPYYLSKISQEQKIEEMGIRYNEVNSTNFNYQKSVPRDLPESSDKMDDVYIRGLEPNTEYEYAPYVKINGKIYCSSNIQKTRTKEPTFTITLLGSTQTTLTLDVSPSTDETTNIKEMGIEYGNHRFKADSDGKVIVTGLTANQRCNIRAYAVYQAAYIYSYYQTFSTKGIDESLIIDELTPTFASIIARFDLRDAKVGKIEISCGKTTSNSSILEISQLDPNTNYSAYLTIYDDKNNIIGSCTKSFNTPNLVFKTLPAKATSNTVAVLSATTNISDEEAQTGFEWRRYDAPDLVPSTQSACPVIDGELIGALKNLNANTYYKYRPYYTSASEKTYYGDWLAFGTADAYVYFDPTVKTYSASDITDNSAIVHGYVITGSGKILKQGFEYWVAKDNGARYSFNVSAPEVKVVEVEGTTIKLTLSNLSPDTKYAYRVFAETDEGTVYGEEMTFITQELSSIGMIEPDRSTITVVGYYDLQGRKLSTPARGINIIRYSNGTSRKILIR